MNITKSFNEKELTLSVEGRIDTITSQDLSILDFANLEYISSAGLRVLMATQKKLKAEGIPFVIKNVNEVINEIFRMSGFDKILKIE